MALRLGCSLLSRRLASALASASADALTAQVATVQRAAGLVSQLQGASQPTVPQMGPRFSSTLTSKLLEEYAYERDNYEQDPVVRSGPPAPFTLSVAPGDTEIVLKRKFGNGEEVAVSVTVNDQPEPEIVEDDSGEAAEASSVVSFFVSVNKGAESLVFECISDGSEVQIDHVSLEPKEGFESKTHYTGPVFYELDPQLRNHFQEYLAERGIDENLGEYLRHVVYDKEQQEYTSWLQRVEAFLKK